MHDANPLDDPNADPFAIAADAAAKIAELTGVERHDIALTLGSGWGRAAELIGETTHTIPAHRDPRLLASPRSRATSARCARSLLPSGKRALVIGARTHYYEGHGVRRVVHSRAHRGRDRRDDDDPHQRRRRHQASTGRPAPRC